jgi:hypothetical protein
VEEKKTKNFGLLGCGIEQEQRKNRGSCWDRRTRHTTAGTNHECLKKISGRKKTKNFGKGKIGAAAGMEGRGTRQQEQITTEIPWAEIEDYFSGKWNWAPVCAWCWTEKWRPALEKAWSGRNSIAAEEERTKAQAGIWSGAELEEPAATTEIRYEQHTGM